MERVTRRLQFSMPGGLFDGDFSANLSADRRQNDPFGPPGHLACSRIGVAVFLVISPLDGDLCLQPDFLRGTERNVSQGLIPMRWPR